MNMNIEFVAEAMADADDGIIFGLLTEEEANFYRRMAQAAVDSILDAVAEIPDLGQLQVFMNTDGYHSMRSPTSAEIAERVRAQLLKEAA